MALWACTSAVAKKEDAPPTRTSSVRIGADAGNQNYFFGSLEALLGVSPIVALGAAGRSTRTKEGIAREGEIILDAAKEGEIAGRFSIVGREGPGKIRAVGGLGALTFWLSPANAQLATTLQLDFGLTFYRLRVTSTDTDRTVTPIIRQALLGIGISQDLSEVVTLGFSIYGYHYNEAETILLRLVQGTRLLENSSVGLAASFPRAVGALRATARLHPRWVFEASGTVSRTVLSEQGIFGTQAQLRWMPDDHLGLAARAGAVQAQSDKRIYDYNFGLELEILW